jgi:superfamily II DNA or RNA helicase
MTTPDLTPGVLVDGLDAGGPVTLDRVDRVAGTATLHWRDRLGVARSRLLFPDDLERLQVVVADDVPSLDAEPALFRRAFAAHRLREAHLHAPLLAVASAAVEPLPHQLQAVYEQMLTRRPLRFLLADDPGAGKTIMAGLYVKELLARRLVHRCIIVAPGSLVEQWQEELQVKFGLRFSLFDRSLAAGAPDGNPFLAAPLLIARVDQLARDKALLEQLSASSWDLAVVDEAHKLTARYWGQKVLRSKRFQLGAALAAASTNFLLMTATPHSGKEQDFQLFLSLLDPDRFTGRGSGEQSAADLMRRLVKEQLRHLDGRPLFPERRASTVRYELTPLERELYERVSEYVRHEMDKVAGDDSRRTVGFALLVLQRRLASSPEAVLRSLTRRRDRLRAEADKVRDADARLSVLLQLSLGQVVEDEDDALDRERAEAEDEASAGATASRTLQDLETEILLLEDLVALAERVRAAGVDRKWEQLARLLTAGRMFGPDGRRRKIIVFTEHRDTLTYLQGKVEHLLGDPGAVSVIHGAVSRPQRRAVQDAFTTDPMVSVLLATDAAGEGVNLHVAHLMVNYDLPWNPNRLEQRFGRIHRIGQSEVCHLWNLVASDTREGDVFTTLLDKLAAQREALGDQVFDVLGEVLTGSDLNELLTSAIRYGDRSAVRARLNQVVDQKVGTDLAEAVALRRQHLSDLTNEDLRQARRAMALAAAGTLQPDAVRSFVLDALPLTRSEVALGGDGRYVVSRVSGELRQADRAVDRRYDLVTFDPARIASPGGAPAELLGPGHPLVDSLADLMAQATGEVLKRGLLLADPSTSASSLLVLLRLSVREGEGGDVVSERLVALAAADHEVREVAAQAFALLPGAAPTAAPAREVRRARLEAAVLQASSVLAPAHLGEARDQAQRQREAGMEEVRQRLAAEHQRVSDQLAALLRRPVADAHARAALEASLEDLRLRAQAREVRASSEEVLVAADPEVVAVAWVQGTGRADVDARHARALAVVRAALETEGTVEQALPYSGYDLLLTPEQGSPSFVTTRTEGDDETLSPLEDQVRRNVGGAYRLAVVGHEEDSFGWREPATPAPDASSTTLSRTRTCP